MASKRSSTIFVLTSSHAATSLPRKDLVEITQTCEVARDFCRWKSDGGEKRGDARPGVVCACMLIGLCDQFCSKCAIGRFMILLNLPPSIQKHNPRVASLLLLLP
jgi:hypothetical protein